MHLTVPGTSGQEISEANVEIVLNGALKLLLSPLRKGRLDVGLVDADCPSRDAAAHRDESGRKTVTSERNIVLISFGVVEYTMNEKIARYL